MSFFEISLFKFRFSGLKRFLYGNLQICITTMLLVSRTLFQFFPRVQLIFFLFRSHFKFLVFLRWKSWHTPNVVYFVTVLFFVFLEITYINNIKRGKNYIFIPLSANPTLFDHFVGFVLFSSQGIYTLLFYQYREFYKI